MWHFASSFRGPHKLISTNFIHGWKVGPASKSAYTGRIKNSCLALAAFPERGTKRDDIRPGVRTVGFERRATIAFAISGETVSILGIAYGGRKLKV